jgi:hypothetical protein
MTTTVEDAKIILLDKIATASAAMGDLKKDATNPHFSSKFASLEATMDVIEPALREFGLGHQTVFEGTAIIYRVWDCETGVVVESRVELASILDGLGGNIWQQLGQAFTYMRRYLAQAFWNLVPEDDDAQSVSHRPAAQRKPIGVKGAANTGTPMNGSGDIL